MVVRSKFAQGCAFGLCVLFSAARADAQASPPQPSAPTLKQAFDAAWVLQPEAQSLQARKDAVSARRELAASWSAEPPSLEVSAKSDRVNGNDGIREYQIGVAVPLWLPGERSGLAAVVDAEGKTVDSRALGAQLRLAGEVRNAYWAWQHARAERMLAESRTASANQLAADVRRRVSAGDLARADQHQAEGAVASADSALAEAEGAVATSAQRLGALVGVTLPKHATEARSDDFVLETVPIVPISFATLDTQHPAVVELLDRAELARRIAALTRVQKRANPEISIGTSRERDGFGERYQQAIVVGLRVPFGSDARNRYKAAVAQAELFEASGQLQLERQRLMAELDAAQVRMAAAQKQLNAAAHRARLADETRGFFEKSFRLGESDLPTRLRIELETGEAQRQAARARIELGAAISAFRQALGLLPD